MLFRSAAAELSKTVNQVGISGFRKVAFHHLKYLEMRVGRGVGFPMGENVMQGFCSSWDDLAMAPEHSTAQLSSGIDLPQPILPGVHCAFI
jgi:hypothetical protein